MNSQFEHLQLPRINIELPKRRTGGGRRDKRDNRGVHVIENEKGVSILTLNKNFQGAQSLFRAYFGTSFAAPRVANLAAKLFTIFPNATPNLIGALIADSADIPEEIPSDFKNDEKQQLKVYGYGQSNFEKAAYST